MFGLTPLGSVHTLIALVALVAGFGAIVRDGRIGTDDALSRTYIWTTVLTCLTGFGIFQHGGFGVPHALGIVTLAVIGLALWRGGSRWFGGLWRYVPTVALSLTLFFHLIPGATETFTRLPAGRPLFSGPEDPALQKVVGLLFLLFLAGAALQVWWLRGQSQRKAPVGATRDAR